MKGVNGQTSCRTGKNEPPHCTFSPYEVLKSPFQVAVMLGQLELIPLSQSPRETCNRLAGQKTHHLLQKTKVHYHAHRSPPPPVPYPDPRHLSVRSILILYFHLSLGVPILRKANTMETGAWNQVLLINLLVTTGVYRKLKICP
jgi:hypothetical protein